MSGIKPWRECIEKHDAYIIMCNVLDELYEKEAIKKEVFKRLRQAPSTDRTGNWLESNGKLAECYYDVYCSECGETSEYRGLYCPECGAFMINEYMRRRTDDYIMENDQKTFIPVEKTSQKEESDKSKSEDEGAK